MIRWAVHLAIIVALATGPVGAQVGPADQAVIALKSLEEASQQLEDARKARDRVKALTATVRAFEQGLGAMREGLRQAAIQERALSDRLQAQESEVAALLGALQSIGRLDSPQILLHPSGALGTARAGMLLAEISPALNTRADWLRRDLDDIQTLRRLQQDAASRMAQGLSEIQNARAELNQALADREDLPKRFVTDPDRAAILIASAETLDGFASGLSQIVAKETAPPLELDTQIGNLPLPVQGLVLRKANEADAAGVVRPGVLLATRPAALVTSPVAATIRYVGPLLDLGQVVILEPQVNSLIILTGLAQTYGTAGQVISQSEPLGIMGGGNSATDDQLLSPIGEGTGTERSETLYIEVRDNNRPVDPAKWFAFGPEG